MSLLKIQLCLLIGMALDFGYLLLKMSEAVGCFLVKSLSCPFRRLKFTSITYLGGSWLSVTSPSPSDITCRCPLTDKCAYTWMKIKLMVRNICDYQVHLIMWCFLVIFGQELAYISHLFKAKTATFSVCPFPVSEIPSRHTRANPIVCFWCLLHFWLLGFTVFFLSALGSFFSLKWAPSLFITYFIREKQLH